jgi:hypothetical protein
MVPMGHKAICGGICLPLGQHMETQGVMLQTPLHKGTGQQRSMIITGELGETQKHHHGSLYGRSSGTFEFVQFIFRSINSIIMFKLNQLC